MTDPLDRIRAIALVLPESEERDSQGEPTFVVADTPFARVHGADSQGAAVLWVRTSGDEEQAMPVGSAPQTCTKPADLDAGSWVAIALAGEADWTLVEDRIARSWELSAPAALLEAGGR